MARTLSSDEVGVIADQTICDEGVLEPWRFTTMQQPLIDFANAILKAYSSDPLSLVTAQREAWDAGCGWVWGGHSIKEEVLARLEARAERDRRYPLPAPPAPEPVLSEADVERLSNDVIADSSQAFIRLVERVVLTTQQERAK